MSNEPLTISFMDETGEWIDIMPYVNPFPITGTDIPAHYNYRCLVPPIEFTFTFHTPWYRRLARRVWGWVR